MRVGNLQELVYKHGQAGVTKASVTLVFNNSDKAASPVGYEQYDQITVTRQVIIGGRNKYLINGMRLALPMSHTVCRAQRSGPARAELVPLGATERQQSSLPHYARAHYERFASLPSPP